MPTYSKHSKRPKIRSQKSKDTRATNVRSTSRAQTKSAVVNDKILKPLSKAERTEHNTAVMKEFHASMPEYRSSQPRGSIGHKLVVGDIGTPNYGYNLAGDQGDFTPATLHGLEVQYMGSFGANWFNLRVGATPGTGNERFPGETDGITVYISGIGSASFNYNGSSGKYEGFWSDIAAILGGLEGKTLNTTVDIN